MTRRELSGTLLRIVPTIALLDLSRQTGAFASAVEPLVARWFRELHELCGDLKARRLGPLQWQQRIESLYGRIELGELLRFLDLDRLIRGLDYPADRAAVVQPALPAIDGIPRRPGYGRKIFALRRRTAIVPHGHNNMVSAHLVLRGSFHVRTYDRVRDEPGSLILAPSIDASFAPGRVLTMSDHRDNVHWFVAETDHAYTFDVPVTDIDSGRHYVIPAQHSSMIHVDPLGATVGDGHIRARVIEPRESIALFGAAGGGSTAHEVGRSGS